MKRRLLEFAFVLTLFIILAAMLFGRTLTLPPGNMLFGIDSHSFLFFIFDYLVKTVKSGHIPWWNPYMFSGVPMLAIPAGGSLFYPPNVLFFLFPVSRAIIAHFLLHITLAGVGMFWFSRKYLDVWSSLVAALILSFGGYMIGAVYMGHIETVAAMAWLPVILGSVDRFLAAPKRKYFFLLTASLAMQILAGTYIAVIFTLELISLFYLFTVITVWIPAKAKSHLKTYSSSVSDLPRRQAGKFSRSLPRDFSKGSNNTDFRGFEIASKKPIIWMGGLLILSILLAAGVSAIQLIPFWENAREGIRASGLPLAIAGRDSFNWNLFSIFYTSLTTSDTIVLDPIQNITLGSNINFEFLYFLGFSTLGLIGFSFLSEGYRLFRRIYIKFFPNSTDQRVTGVGGPPRRGPLVGFLGGRHLAGPARDTGILPNVHPIWIFTFLAAIVFLALAFGKNFFLYNVLYVIFPPYQLVRRPVRHLMIVAFCAAFLGGWGTQRLKYRLAKICAILLVAFELIRFGQAYIRVNPEPYVTNDRTMISWLKDHPEEGRIHLNFRNSGITGLLFYENAGMYYGLPMVNGYSPMLLNRYYQFTRTASLIEGAALTKIFPLKLDSPVVNYLSARYVIDQTFRDEDRDDRQIPAYFTPVYTSGNVTVYENPKAFPRFFLVGDIGATEEERNILPIIVSGKIDLARAAIMTRGEAGRALATVNALTQEKCTSENSLGSVIVRDYRDNSIALAVSARCPAALVTSEPWYPGWEARVDGVQTPIYVANYAFRSIIVPKGDHIVEFSYNPRIFLYGGAVSALSMLVFLLVLLGWKRIVQASHVGNPDKILFSLQT